jgi:hypothetical protein
MIFRGGESSTGEMGNFHPALTLLPSWVVIGRAPICDAEPPERFPRSTKS